MHGFIVTGFFLSHLFAKTLRLILGVIQLGKTVGDFPATDEKLKALGHFRIIVTASRQGRHFGRVLGNEGGLLKAVFDGFLENLDLHTAQTPVVLERNIEVLGNLPRGRFVAERGDDYLREVEADDLPFLYPCASLLRGGVPVGASTDAPYTHVDPWRAIEAARTRTTVGGVVLGPGEAVPARRALDLFLGTADDPGGPPRMVVPGAPADLCLLATPLVDALRAPLRVEVVTTFVDGRPVPGGPLPLPRR